MGGNYTMLGGKCARKMSISGDVGTRSGDTCHNGGFARRGNIIKGEFRVPRPIKPLRGNQVADYGASEWLSQINH